MRIFVTVPTPSHVDTAERAKAMRFHNTKEFPRNIRFNYFHVLGE